MKNLKLRIIGIATVMAFAQVTLAGCKAEKPLSSAEIPQEIAGFVTTHFPGNPILHSIKERDVFSHTYEILLEGNITLEFNRNRELTYLESATAISGAILPEPLQKYIKSNYPGTSIVEWDLEGRNQHVELDNGLSLIFNRNGEFLRLDM
ncbi:MAG TPA: PepSY-like domain-containing protein [Bacteroidales bacterium]|nr:PepSY-like domain-containing protein [Bacteroidales bacterium]